MSEWPTVPLGDLTGTDGFAIGPFGSRMKTHHYTESGPRVVRGQNITARGRIEGDFVHVSQDFADSLGSARLRPGDVTLPHRGAIGRAALVTDDDLVMSTSLMRVRVNPLTADPRFVAAFLSSSAGSDAILQFASTVGTPGIGQPLASLRKVQVPHPPLDEQQRIAGVLGALDDLIDANRSQVQALEELARSVAASSPRKVHLADVATASTPHQLRPTGLVEHYSLPSFDSGATPEVVSGSEIKSAKLPVSQPAVLVSRLNPRWERCWMAYPGRNAVASTEFALLTGVEGVASEEIWAITSARDFWDQMRSRVTGTTGSHQRVDKKALLTLMVPDVRALSGEQRKLLTVLAKEAHSLRVEIADLTRTRNELLPLLMSGKIRVSDSYEVT